MVYPFSLRQTNIGSLQVKHQDGATDYPTKNADSSISFLHGEKVTPLLMAAVNNAFLALEVSSGRRVYEE